jgi:hypothetical protein
MILALPNPGRDLQFSFDLAVLTETIKCNVTGPALVDASVSQPSRVVAAKSLPVSTRISGPLQYQQGGT